MVVRFNLVIINDTQVIFSQNKGITGSFGGTASFLAGFLTYLKNIKLNAHLIGNFCNFNELPFPFKTITASSNIKFLAKLSLHLIISGYNKREAIFYCHRPDHMAISLLAKGKHVVHLHGQAHTTINSGRSRIKKYIYNHMERYAMLRADLIIATDSITANLYTRLYPSIKSHLIIIPTGVNLDEFKPENKRQAFPGIQPKTSNLVYIGRLAYPKQVSAIIASFENAFNNNPSIHLWIAGAGPDEKLLRHQALQTRWSGNIHFTGQLNRENVKSLIHSSDAGILLSHNEGSPITVKEFLACGKPIIVNNVGDLIQYVSDGVNGFVVDTLHPESIENAMIKIIHQGKEMAEACRASMLAYDEGIIFEQVYRSLMNLQLS